MLPAARERQVWDLDIDPDGHIYLQSLSSMLPPLLLAIPRAGADILDMCAAPGGKTSQIAALTANSAHLTACEMSAPRADKLAYNLDKLGAANVNVMRTDARRLDEFFSFDQILLDAPCTGTGTYRAGDERAERRMTGQLLAKVVKSQRALLDRALTVLKPGGTLVYSTCSVLDDENDAQVRAALKRHRDCEVAPILLEEPAIDAGDGARGQGDSVRPAVLPLAAQGPLACPVLEREDGIPGTLTVVPTRLFEGFYVAVDTEKSPAGNCWAAGGRYTLPERWPSMRSSSRLRSELVLERGEGEVGERHAGDREGDHEHGGEDIENAHMGHRPFLSEIDCGVACCADPA